MDLEWGRLVTHKTWTVYYEKTPTSTDDNVYKEATYIKGLGKDGTDVLLFMKGVFVYKELMQHYLLGLYRDHAPFKNIIKENDRFETPLGLFICTDKTVVHEEDYYLYLADRMKDQRDATDALFEKRPSSLGVLEGNRPQVAVIVGEEKEQ